MIRFHTSGYLILFFWLLFTITLFTHINTWPQAPSHTIPPPPPPEQSRRHKSSSPNSHIKDTKLLVTDLIYSRDWWEKPTVIEEYKLIFFAIPKNGCSEWKLLFRKMMGMPIPKDIASHDVRMQMLYNPQTNNRTTLDKYPIHVAEEMMNSPEWTRAVFLREPKERILSAFLDKFVVNNLFIRKCCKKKNKQSECQAKREEKDFWYFLNSDCKDPHWEPQMTMIDAKWWPHIDFIGLFSSIDVDAKRLLQSLKSSKDGKSAWEKVGKSGWGRNGTSGFLQKNSSFHRSGAKDLFAEYYNKDYEAFVEEKWKVEWASPYSPFKISNGKEA
jgi:hypothetical protein